VEQVTASCRQKNKVVSGSQKLFSPASFSFQIFRVFFLKLSWVSLTDAHDAWVIRQYSFYYDPSTLAGGISLFSPRFVVPYARLKDQKFSAKGLRIEISFGSRLRGLSLLHQPPNTGPFSGSGRHRLNEGRTDPRFGAAFPRLGRFLLYRLPSDVSFATVALRASATHADNWQSRRTRGKRALLPPPTR